MTDKKRYELAISALRFIAKGQARYCIDCNLHDTGKHWEFCLVQYARKRLKLLGEEF